MSRAGTPLPPRVRLLRLLALVGFAVVMGVGADWLAGEGRLLFPRPRPEFRRVPPP